MNLHPDLDRITSRSMTAHVLLGVLCLVTLHSIPVPAAKILHIHPGDALAITNEFSDSVITLERKAELGEHWVPVGIRYANSPVIPATLAFDRPWMLIRFRATDFSDMPVGMRLVPEGPFTMGDAYDESDPQRPAGPVHSVYISSFYMDQYEVSKQLWDEVKQWASANFYAFENPGFGFGQTHPVTEITWYDALKWCNARSESEGRQPVYYTTAATTTVYRSGVGIPFPVWDADGYRLPTEAEWEKAARGGLDGHHYPWPSDGGTYTDHINGGLANYKDSGDPFDNMTTPVGYYDGNQEPDGPDTANGYGLYDVAGNVWEWCWDRYQVDWYERGEASLRDTRGPSTGDGRIVRGGAFSGDDTGQALRCAYRNEDGPGLAVSYVGLRCVRSAP